MNLDRKTAVITGGASGLGYATAVALAQAGANVVLVDLPVQRAAGVAGASAIGDRALFVPADVSSSDGLAAAVATAASAFGGVDIAVGCAGVATAGRILNRAGAPLPLEQFEAVVRINLVGSFNLLRLAAAQMAQRPAPQGGDRGVVVLTASAAAYEGQVGQAAYAASKGGIVSLTLTAARDLADLGIRVVAIAPGTFDTPMLAGLSQETRQRLAEQVPYPRRLGRPDEFAALVVHIAANEMLNGAVIRLDGALRMSPR